MPSRSAPLLVALAFAVVAAACGGGDSKEKAIGTTSTAAASAGRTYPLTGLPLPEPAPPNRQALVIKIDNAPKGRPQAGVNQADVVVEEQVEGGITRLASIFHSTDAGSVGPVRSARSTDIAIITPLRLPLFAYSGTNATFLKLVRAAPLVDIGHSAAASEYRRERGRPAPYNLFTTTSGLWARGPSAEDPPPLFTYRVPGERWSASGARPVRGVHYEFRDIVTTIVDFTWDANAGGPDAGGWRRVQQGTAHVDAGGVQIAPVNVVVQFTRHRDTGERDQSGAVVPEAELIGGGEAWVFSGGELVKGKWSKASAEVPTSYRDAKDRPIELLPGRTWVVLLPPGKATSLE